VAIQKRPEARELVGQPPAPRPARCCLNAHRR
jgi:hypothetical protein